MLKTWLRKWLGVSDPTPPAVAAPRAALNMQPVPVVDGPPRIPGYFDLPQTDATDMFRAATPAPNVRPAGSRSVAMDSAINAAAGWAAGALGQAGGAYGTGVSWIGYPALAELTQIPEYRRPAEILAKEMTREWINLVAEGADTSKTEKLKLLKEAMEKFRVQELFRKLAEVDGFFGRAQLYIDTGHGDVPEELTKPLIADPRKIPVGKLKGFKVMEPIWTYPGFYNASDPLHRDFYRPTAWYVMGKTIHETRLLTFVARPVPDLLKPAYAFGGLSLSQMAIPYVNNWLRTRQSISDLINMFSTTVLSTNMATVIQDGGDNKGLLSRLAMFTLFRNNRGVFAIDKDSEELTNTSAPIAGLDKLQAQAQEQMAAVVGIPLVILLGITPSGLNASSDGEIKTFYAWIKAQQEQLFTAHLRKVIDLIQLNEFGVIDPEIGFEYVPLWQMSEAEESQIRKETIDGDSAMIADGVVSPEEVRLKVANDPSMGFDGIDLSGPPPEPPADEADGLFGPGDPQDGEDDPNQPKLPGFGQDEWNESDHPRADNGRFGSGGGNGEASGKRPFGDTSALPTTDKVAQPATSWAELTKKGAVGREQFAAALGTVAKKMGLSTALATPEDLTTAHKGSFLFIAPNKSEARAAAKVEHEYDGDWSQLKDMVRGSIVVESMADLDKAIEAVRASGLELAAQPKDKFAKPTAEGYRDLNTLVRMPNGMLAELQYHVRPIIEAKNEAHDLYAEQQHVSRKNGGGEPSERWSKEDARAFNTLREQQRKIYADAWAQVI